jgi:hypothetical protein
VYESDFFVHLAIFNKVLGWEVYDEKTKNQLYEKYKIDRKAIYTILENRKVAAQRLKIKPLDGNYSVEISEFKYDVLRDMICDAFSDQIFAATNENEKGEMLYRSLAGKGKGLRKISKESIVETRDFLIGNPIDIENLNEYGESKVTKLLTFATIPTESWLARNRASSAREDKIVKLDQGKPHKGRMNGRNLPNGRGRIG